MQDKFSQTLRDRIKEYFEKYHSLMISDEQADEYLDSLAELFITFNTMREWRSLRRQAQCGVAAVILDVFGIT